MAAGRVFPAKIHFKPIKWRNGNPFGCQLATRLHLFETWPHSHTHTKSSGRWKMAVSGISMEIHRSDRFAWIFHHFYFHFDLSLCHSIHFIYLVHENAIRVSDALSFLRRRLHTTFVVVTFLPHVFRLKMNGADSRVCVCACDVCIENGLWSWLMPHDDDGSLSPYTHYTWQRMHYMHSSNRKKKDFQSIYCGWFLESWIWWSTIYMRFEVISRHQTPDYLLFMKKVRFVLVLISSCMCFATASTAPTVMNGWRSHFMRIQKVNEKYLLDAAFNCRRIAQSERSEKTKDGSKWWQLNE